MKRKRPPMKPKHMMPDETMMPGAKHPMPEKHEAMHGKPAPKKVVTKRKR